MAPCIATNIFYMSVSGLHQLRKVYMHVNSYFVVSVIRMLGYVSLPVVLNCILNLNTMPRMYM